MKGRQQSPAILDCVLWIVALALAGSAVVALVVVLLWWWRKVFLMPFLLLVAGGGDLHMNLRLASPEIQLPCRVHSVKAIELRHKVGLLVAH